MSEPITDATEIMKFMYKKMSDLHIWFRWVADGRIAVKGKTGNRVHLERIEAAFECLALAMPYLIEATFLLEPNEELDHKTETIIDIIEGRIKP